MRKICLVCGEWFYSNHGEKLCDRCKKKKMTERGTGVPKSRLRFGFTFTKYFFYTGMLVIVSVVVYGVIHGLIHA